MIPKTIHYCWFGRNPKPKLAKKCIKSWQKYCPDYEIIEWNEDNFDIAAAPLYVRQAYEAKKWAFVTDYVRLWALTAYGGIYMDTDVEVIKPLDEFLVHHAFSGFEDPQHIPTGIMGCEKNHPLFEKLKKYYYDKVFLKADGTYDITTNVEIITSLLSEYGLSLNNNIQDIEGFVLYPTEYFCPLDCQTGRLSVTSNTVCIHWFSASWFDEIQKKKREHNWYVVKKKDMVHHITRFPNRLLIRVMGVKNYENLKKRLKRK